MTERGAWVKEELLNRLTFKPGEEVSVKGGGFFSNVEPTLGHDRYAALIELSSFSLTEAPDAERALLEQKVIEAGRAMKVSAYWALNVPAFTKALAALDAHIAKTAKPKREEGKWYAGKLETHEAPRPWLFGGIDCFRRDECSVGWLENEFDWISDTPLDLRKE